MSFKKFGDKLPKGMDAQADRIKARLSSAK